jgi:arylsulfatase
VQTPSVLNGVPQKPIEGVSMAYTFSDAKAPSRHRTQYFEMAANRAIYDDGWVACTTPPVAPWVSVWKPIDIDDYKWELYHVAEDFSQAVNLADKEPAKLRALQDLFWIEAAKYNVLPIDNRRVERMDVSLRPSPTAGRSVFTYYDGQTRIPEGSAPDIKNKSFKIAADLEIPEGGADGLVITQGGRFGGWSLCFLGGKPVFQYNVAGVFQYSVAAKEKLGPGRHALVLSFDYDGGGIGKGGKVTMTADDKTIAEGRIDNTIPFRISLDETLDIGEDTGTAVSNDYTVPFHFTGQLNRVIVRTGDAKLTAEDEEQIRRAKAAIGMSQ